MTWRISHMATVVAMACLAAGCATSFSPSKIRREIELQQGRDPLKSFEVNLGRFTTYLIKTALTGEDGEAPFAGLKELQLAVYEAPNEDGPAIDVTRIKVRGWEPVIRAHDPSRSALVLIRGGQSEGDAPDEIRTVGDLVVVGAGPRKVVYARLRGSLGADLPMALGDALRKGGPDEVERLLNQFAEQASSN